MKKSFQHNDFDLTPQGYPDRPRTWEYVAVAAALVYLIFLTVLLHKCEKRVQELPEPPAPTVHAYSAPAHEYLTDQERLTLNDLMFCESSGQSHAMGDNGKSSGYYQWQKVSLEEVMSKNIGRQIQLTEEEWLTITQNYQLSTYWTYYSLFELGQSWRWKNCLTK